jgi:hypothetical protein
MFQKEVRSFSGVAFTATRGQLPEAEGRDNHNCDPRTTFGNWRLTLATDPSC